MKVKEDTPPSDIPVSVLPNFIASNLRVLRRQAGWSQSELAERVGLNRGNIASYECGTAEPSICKLLRFSQLFGISTRDFTRRDLQDPTDLALARSAQLTTEPAAPRERFAEFHEQYAQLAQLIESSHQLFEYKRARSEKPCKEAELFAAYYMQLHELTQQLSQQHDHLLRELGCSCQ
jgi:transcriptional regulator with XRE-family HTH domain